MGDIRKKKENYWKKKLSLDAYRVLRQRETEAPFTGALYNNHKTGMYFCGACEQGLFSSKTKFDSGSGWPSFDDPVNSKNLEFKEDNSLGVKRTEVICRKCGSHLGHLFNDGPKETTGLRYCINSSALNFKESK